MYFLRAPPTKEEKKVTLFTLHTRMFLNEFTRESRALKKFRIKLQSLIIGEKSSVRYVTYQNEEEDQ